MPRFTDKELKAAVGPTKKNSKLIGQPKIDNTQNSFYDATGARHSKLDSEKVVAQRLNVGKEVRCQIRANRMNELFNPFDDFYMQESLRRARMDGTDPFRMLQVPATALNDYLSFLQTKDTNYLRFAQRGI